MCYTKGLKKPNPNIEEGETEYNGKTTKT